VCGRELSSTILGRSRCREVSKAAHFCELFVLFASSSHVDVCSPRFNFLQIPLFFGHLQALGFDKKIRHHLQGARTADIWMEKYWISTSG
jgi:hypothetical protein